MWQHKRDERCENGSHALTFSCLSLYRPAQRRRELSDRLDPDLFAAFVDTLALIGIVCAAAQFSPESMTESDK